MWPPILAIILIASAADALRPRYNYVTSVSGSYDFIICGGGVAGLVLAARLSEDSNTTVLVLEAGDSGELVQSRIDTPGLTYYNGLTGSSYDWSYTTVAQPNAGNRVLTWPRGKVLGGSSAINGMFLVRPSEIEMNAMRDLIAPNDQAAAEAIWGWSSFKAAMDKSETFTAPIASVQSQDDVEYNAASRGNSGPLHSSYPAWSFPVIGDFLNSLVNVGVSKNTDAGSGNTWGGFVTTSAINPTNWTRSYSRSAYIDPLPPRSNLVIVVNATVTRVTFKKDTSGLTATGVEYSTGGSLHTVQANKEVILSSGVVGSPQLLMVSGVGPKDVLTAAGVTVLSELPGVGQHLQDHLSVPITWQTSTKTARDLYNAGTATPESLSYVNSATSYINMTAIFGDGASSVISNIMDSLDSSASSLVPSTDSTVVAGFKATYNATAAILNSPVGAIEMILNLIGAGTIGVIVGLQHPLSQGRLYINSSSVFVPPVIDPNYFSHPTDKVIFREALKMARGLAAIAPLSSSIGTEVSPGSTVSTDDDAAWDAWYTNQVTTEYHPGSSCSMLPLAQGGVVNAQLQVYGTTNLRVIDSSIFPISMSAHFMAATYGLAEKGAEIIRAKYQPNGSPTTTSTPGSSSDQSPTKLTNDAAISSIVSTRIFFCSFLALLLVL
ncbi:GMC oxidoreductase [Mycena floridula]|nr:GMC oxidoreductase [Mycena floridula]